MSSWEKWNTDFNDRLPIYQQIIDRFCRSFVKKEIPPGDRIPSIRDMALILKVNANTIQRVYQEMERKELIFSRRGTGYFVTEDSNMVQRIQRDMAQDSTGRFLEEMRSLGYTDRQILTEISHRMEGETKNGHPHSDEGN